MSLLLALASCATSPSQEAAWTGLDEQQRLDLALEGAHLDRTLSGLGIEREDMHVRSFEVDELELGTLRMAQRHQGLRVFEGEIIVHLGRDGQLVGASDHLVDNIRVDTAPWLTEAEGLQAAAAFAGVTEQTEEPRIELVVVRREGVDHLAWMVQLTALLPGQPRAPLVFVDAHDGSLVELHDNLRKGNATGTTNYYGSVSIKTVPADDTYYLEDLQRTLGTFTMENTTSTAYYIIQDDNDFTQAGYETAVDVHYGMERTWEYFLRSQGWTGIDKNGGPGYAASVKDSSATVLSAFVHYDTHYANAFWYSGYGIFFGDGDGTSYDSMTSLDIVAHEWTHGVTEHTAGFTYSDESGALDEAFGDIFGVVVEADTFGESADIWTIGEEVSLTGDPVRDLSDPSFDGYTRAHVDDQYTGSADNGGVHLNMGIITHAFYMLSEGGTHVDYGGTTVTGVGVDAGGDIAFRALKKYLSASSDFLDGRQAFLAAAHDLYGADSQEYASTMDAFSNVGLGSDSSLCGTGYTSMTASLPRPNGSNNFWYPSSAGYTTTSSGTHEFALYNVDDAADADLYLWKYNSASGKWVKVDKANTVGDSDEAIRYTGDAGTYRVYVRRRSRTDETDLDLCASWPS